ncbi:TBCC domain-containing protein 1-like isoform X2 [Papaver somniferum]|uniref:TBCC domain-containing protein 1-like isoform X2 n=1 Tax=Papaver somniferum TaxID=3469 RepID=UPI000E6FC199|nr:TBCC domain-containing protein 1-like isoform X2 [Papaver somniferum]
MNEEVEPPSLSSSVKEEIFVRVRREPFEYGLLPIPKLIFSDGTVTLGPLKDKLVEKASTSSYRIDADGISQVLNISTDYAHLVIQTLASVLPSSDFDPIPTQSNALTADVYHLILFLYIQSYKKLLPRTHKDSASVSDVWPSTSAFDGFVSFLSPLQLVRSNSRRFMPSQADEESHQLSYLQKHLANILSLLADSVDGEDEESLVLTLERFEHLGFLIQFGEKGSNRIPLSQAAPFFANSDPDMPAIPVPAGQVHDWILQNIEAALEHKISSKEGGSPVAADQDIPMADSGPSSCKGLSEGSQSFVEGISKTSVVKQASDLKGSSVKVLNCQDAVVYILAPLKYATVYGCSDATIVFGAIGKAVRVEHCERVQVITATKRITIANCRECVFYVGVNQRPLYLGDNHKLQVAPYNTFYSQLEEHLSQVGVDTTINKWNEPLVLGVVNPHDSLSHPAGVSDVQAESATCLNPDHFTNFVHQGLEEIRQALRDIQLEENRKRELSCALHVYFKDWLYASGNIRQLYCLHGD